MRERPSPEFEGETPAASNEVEETRRLRKTGNSYGVTLSRRALDVSGLPLDAPVRVAAEPGRVVISAEAGAYDRTREAAREALNQYRWAFEKLGE